MMSDVFISYSRLDKDFVGKLREALVVKDQDVWIDWEDIPPSQAWWGEIQKGIARANNVVVVLSPNSMASPICHLEIEYARQLGKRIIPVLRLDYKRDEAIASMSARLADLDPKEDGTRQLWDARQPHNMFDANDGELAHINYFFFRPEEDFDARFKKLLETIGTDYEHKEKHTTLDLRAQEWNHRARDASFLLLDVELAEAQAWLQSSEGKDPPPTPLHTDYIEASDKRTRQLRNIRRASIIGSTIAVIAIIFAAVALYAGIQATNRVNEANSTLTPIPATLTQAAIIRQDAEDEQEIAEVAADALLNAENFPSDSLASISALDARFPGRPNVVLWRGLLYDNLGEYEDAIDDYSRAIELDPEYALAYMNRGNAYDSQGEHRAAIDDYNRAIELDPENALAYYNRAETNIDLGEYEAAIADGNLAIELDPEYALAYNIRGFAYYSQGQYEAATASYDRAIVLDPEYALAYMNRGLALYEQDERERAIADFDAVIEIDPDNVDAYNIRGIVYLEQEAYEQAIADFDAVIEIDSDHVNAHFNRGLVYDEQDDYERAIVDYSTVIDIDPDHVDAYNNRGTMYLEQEAYEQAIADFDAAIERDPEDALVYLNRGLTFYVTEDYAAALADWETMESLGGELPDGLQEIREEIQAELTATPEN